MRARSIGFPVALKNDEAWERVVNPAVSSTVVAYNVAELERLASGWTSMPSVIVQKYVPYEESEDWLTQIYAGSDTERWLTFTGDQGAKLAGVHRGDGGRVLRPPTLHPRRPHGVAVPIDGVPRHRRARTGGWISATAPTTCSTSILGSA